MLLNSTFRSVWGPKPGLVRWMVNAMAFPVLTYAAMCWGHECSSEGTAGRLLQLNRLAMLLMALFVQSTPSRALQIITHSQPLDLKMRELGINAFLRLNKAGSPLGWAGTGPTKKHNISHLQFWQNQLDELGLREMVNQTDNLDLVMPAKHYEVVIDESLANRREQLFAAVTAFADGSRIEGHCGSGLAVYGGEARKLGATEATLEHCECLRLSDNSTVYQAEVYAVLRVAVWAYSHLENTSLNNLCRLTGSTTCCMCRAAILEKYISGSICAESVGGQKYCSQTTMG